uniref:Uncharacterized protein n=1 Tax=Romanomermis culicivorax TaxID=13658 RepID=A0A915HUZ7_ROMCU
MLSYTIDLFVIKCPSNVNREFDGGFKYCIIHCRKPTDADGRNNSFINRDCVWPQTTPGGKGILPKTRCSKRNSTLASKSQLLGLKFEEIG